jgi:hypothetical protein
MMEPASTLAEYHPLLSLLSAFFWVIRTSLSFFLHVIVWCSLLCGSMAAIMGKSIDCVFHHHDPPSHLLRSVLFHDIDSQCCSMIET